VPLHLNLPLRSPHECLVGTKREVCERVEPSPLTLALSLNPRNGDGGPKLGRGKIDPGRRTRDAVPQLLPRA
jgi:hypothetical protein